MADEIVYVTVAADVVEIVDVESMIPEPVIVNVFLGEGIPSDVSEGYSFWQEAEPNATNSGQTWFNTATGASYVFFDSFWVQTSPGQIPPDGLAELINSHITDPTPHVAYDNISSLTLIYENQIV